MMDRGNKQMSLDEVMKVPLQWMGARFSTFITLWYLLGMSGMCFLMPNAQLLVCVLLLIQNSSKPRGLLSYGFYSVEPLISDPWTDLREPAFLWVLLFEITFVTTWPDCKVELSATFLGWMKERSFINQKYDSSHQSPMM